MHGKSPPFSVVSVKYDAKYTFNYSTSCTVLCFNLLRAVPCFKHDRVLKLLLLVYFSANFEVKQSKNNHIPEVRIDAIFTAKYNLTEACCGKRKKSFSFII
jgi:hypothetical protein